MSFKQARVDRISACRSPRGVVVGSALVELRMLITGI
jgi:hypothetical protein